MLPEKIKIEILTPQKRIYAGDVSAVRIPGTNGYFGVYPGHTPFLTTLRIGEIKIVTDKQTSYFSTSDGVVEILPDSISILSETCEPASEIDLKRAEAAKERAEKRIQEGRKNWDVDRAHVALLRAMNRIKISSKN